MNNTEEIQKKDSSTNQVEPVLNSNGEKTPTPSLDKPTLAEPMGNQIEQGVNLIPSLTKEEKIHFKKKNTLNVGSLLTVILLSTVAIGIVGFNITSKMQLNSKKNSLTRIEKDINSKIDKISSNDIILTRLELYETVRKNSFSHKAVIEFLNEIKARVNSTSFRSITISEDLSFELSGSSPDLEQLSRLWYLFGVNENIEMINLSSVSKTETGATFSFEGKLKLDNFKNQ